MYEQLRILHWPDPHLRQTCQPVRQFTPQLRELAKRMLELMHSNKGVGLAAPQVGQTIRLFVMNHTGQPGDDRVYVNPILSDPAGEEVGEEGCLSLPNITAQISRSRTIRMQAQDLDGQPIDQVESGYVARIWQHECDHLNGVLITDRMGLGDRFKCRRALQELEEAYARQHPHARPSSRLSRSRAR